MKSKEVEAIVLAGGKGERMGRLCEKKQKCLLPIDDMPILQYIMEELIKAFGSVSLKVALSHRAEDVKNFTERNKSKNLEATYLYDEGKGTYEAYNNFRNFIEGPFFIGIPGDVIVPSATYLLAFETNLSTGLPITLTFSPDIKEADTHALGIVEKGKVAKLIWPSLRGKK